MRFKGLDLNLLVAFDVLLEEKSVARAATRVGLSQPATSSALARLREFFNDDILVVQGRRMYSTPYAESLIPQVRECLRVADSLIATSTIFDPGTSQRVFRIVGSDFIIASIFAPLLKNLTDVAPFIGFEFISPDEVAQDLMRRGEIDLFVAPTEFLSSEEITELLFEEQHVVVGCRDNTIFKGPITEDEVFNRGHVAVLMGAQRVATFGDRQLQLLGKPRRIEVTAASFTTLPWLLLGTERLAVMHERLAEAMADHFSITYAPLPFRFPKMREMVQHHRSKAGDEGLKWLLSHLKGYVAQTALIQKPNRTRSKH